MATHLQLWLMWDGLVWGDVDSNRVALLQNGLVFHRGDSGADGLNKDGEDGGAQDGDHGQTEGDEGEDPGKAGACGDVDPGSLRGKERGQGGGAGGSGGDSDGELGRVVGADAAGLRLGAAVGQVGSDGKRSGERVARPREEDGQQEGEARGGWMEEVQVLGDGDERDDGDGRGYDGREGEVQQARALEGGRHGAGRGGMAGGLQGMEGRGGWPER